MKKFKLLVNIFIVFFFSFFSSISVFANEFTDLDDAVGIIGRAFNIFVLAAASVLAGVLAYGVWKSSTAVGDPRGLEGAKQTWSYAVIGFVVIVLFFTIYGMVAATLDLPALTPVTLVQNVILAIKSLVEVGSEGTY